MYPGVPTSTFESTIVWQQSYHLTKARGVPRNCGSTGLLHWACQPTISQPRIPVSVQESTRTQIVTIIQQKHNGKCIPARRKRPVSSNFNARTSLSTFSFCRMWPLSIFTRRNTALEFAATNTLGLNGRKFATGTGLESVNTSR